MTPEGFCPRHPTQVMQPTGRKAGGEHIRHCPICTERVRAKTEVLLAMPYLHGNGRPIKQIVLPPVAAWER